MTDRIASLTETPYATVDDAADRLGELLDAFRDRHDRRAVFLTAYHRMTLALQEKLGTGFFEDEPWVRSYLISFANLYRVAVHDHHVGEVDDLPDCWQFTLEHAVDEEGLVLQDLLLGINAHVNHDLALALDEAGLESDTGSKYRDHTAINEVIATVVDPVQQAIADHYSEALGALDELFGRLDEMVTNFSFEKAREFAWRHGRELEKAEGGREHRRAAETLDREVTELAEAIAGPPVVASLVGEFFDGDGEPWWLRLDDGAPSADS
ncbi:MAG: DUF5995 family protein [Bradymonadaceae bacterium]